MRPPQVLREGTKKTVFVNFMDLCKTYDLTYLPLHTICSRPAFISEKINYHELTEIIVYTSRMHRQPEHVMMFLLAEMGTSGSLDGQQRLVIKGRFAPKNFEAILRRYISKFP